MKARTSLATVVALTLLAKVASATPVTGQISLNGYAQAVGSVGMGSATGIDFANGTGTAISGTSGVLTSFGGESGSFNALGVCSNGSCGTIQNIASFAASAPITSFLTLNTGSATTVSFDLSSMTTVVHFAATDSVAFTANGIINFTGYDPTPGTFYLSAQGDNLTSFSATTLDADTPIPEPASFVLLGGTLAALGLRRRKPA